MFIKKVETLIEEQVNLYSKDKEIDHLVTCIKKIIDNEYLFPFLQEISENEKYLSNVLKSSYLHTNGFFKIVLLASSSYKLRLHIWKPNDEYISPEHIHNHRWDFATKIISGSYKMELYTSENGDNEFNSYEYFSPEGEDKYHMKENGLAYLRKSTEIDLSENSSYGISYSELHRVVNLEQEKLTATLILQGSVQQNSTSVFADEPFHSSESVQITRLTLKDFNESVNLLKETVVGVLK